MIMKKTVVILGSTGSIGVNTLEVLKTLKDEFSVYGLSANKNVNKLICQCREFSPSVITIRRRDKYNEVKRKLPDPEIEIFSGIEGLTKMVSDDTVDVVVVAMGSSEAIYPVLKAIDCSKRIAIANKESIVMAGGIIMEKIKQKDVDFIPIDSEHNAIYQCLEGYEDKEEVSEIILTASGGPFIDFPPDRLKRVTPEEAVKHPNWKMGNKISVDSATFMNKALEVIEASYLFDFPPESIKVIVHPESIIHSMIEFVDGNIIALLSYPDIKIAIQYALTYPERYESMVNMVDFSKKNSLTFQEPDLEKFPALRLGYEAAKDKGTLPVVLNAANEVAVENFLGYNLRFDFIPRIVEELMEEHNLNNNPTIEEIVHIDEWARKKTKEKINVLNRDIQK